jgi:hypothetical protein
MTKVVLPIHGGDHCPGGPDPIPCLGGTFPWVILRESISIEHSGDGVPVAVGFSYFTKNYDPNNIFDATDINPIGFQLTVNEEGIYLIDSVCDFTDGFGSGSGTATFDLNPDDCYDPMGFDLEDQTWFMQQDWGTGSSMIRISGIISLAGGTDGASSVTFNPTVNQDTGTTKFFGVTYMKLVQLQSHGPFASWTTDTSAYV